MARKKSTGSKTPTKRKKPAPRSRKTAPVKKTGGLFKRVVLFSLFVLASLGIGAGIYVYTHPKTSQKMAKKIIKPLKIATFSKPDFEIFPIEPFPPKEPPPPAIKPDRRPRMAIIIDDLGYDRKLAEQFFSIDGELTYAILPHSPFRKEIADAAHRKGHEVMLHLPMEPKEYPMIDPGPGAILSIMTPDERIRVLEENIAQIPYVSGINNHMGSKVTADSEQMNQILSIVRKRGLFFIDSRTSAGTRSRSSAKLFKAPFAERDVFLDHVVTSAAVREQLNQLVRIAEKNGSAVGIGHPHQVTVDVLAEMLPKLKGRVQLIRASELVRVIDS